MWQTSRKHTESALCGRFGPLTGHHIQSVPEFGDKKISLCRECHDITDRYDDAVLRLRDHLDESRKLKAKVPSVSDGKRGVRKGPASPISIGQEIVTNKLTLKVERENAKAMVEGFSKGENRHYVTIFTAHRDAWSMANEFHNVPKVISAKRSPPRAEYPLSHIGKALNGNSYSHKAKYVAVLDRIFHIKNDYGMWEKLCSNDVFDIWNPRAPYNSLKDKRDPMILVLRIFEVDRDFTNEIEGGFFIDTVAPREVRLLRPVIARKDFEGVVAKTRKVAKGRILEEERVNDTSVVH